MASRSQRKTAQGVTRATRRGSSRGVRPLARQWDRHQLYEKAVQDPEVDAEFIERTYRKHRGRRPRVLREDFCGTAALCAEWVRRRPEHQAFGIDLDEKTLNWGIQHHLLRLGRPASRVTLIRQDVRKPLPFRADVTVAFNFSYMYFQERSGLRDYFASVRKGLRPGGIFYLDIYGGPETMELREERTEFDEFVYVWDQAAFNPITHAVTNHIHFEFPDGSRLQRAFTYHWRLWQIPEVREIAREAGFRDCIVYWEGTDRRTGEGNGVYRPSLKGDASPAFVSYLLCLR